MPDIQSRQLLRQRVRQERRILSDKIQQENAELIKTVHMKKVIQILKVLSVDLSLESK